MLTFIKHQSALISQGYQCQVVDYNDPASLQYALGGVDTVISTVTGTPQLRLIEAAVQSRVRRFAPAEFEGQPGLRGQIDVLDRGKTAALALLRHYRGYIQSTVFVCGILYERFSVNGMRSQHMGSNTGYGNEGDFIANPRTMTALAPIWDAGHNLSYLCLTSAHDVAQFVVRALDMPSWPTEMSMCGERMTVNGLLEVIRACRSGFNVALNCQLTS
jgi:nucleoside-diphosphate-sugar epimerase